MSMVVDNCLLEISEMGPSHAQVTISSRFHPTVLHFECHREMSLVVDNCLLEISETGPSRAQVTIIIMKQCMVVGIRDYEASVDDGQVSPLGVEGQMSMRSWRTTN